jgi:hypothetical protein
VEGTHDLWDVREKHRPRVGAFVEQARIRHAIVKIKPCYPRASSPTTGRPRRTATTHATTTLATLATTHVRFIIGAIIRVIIRPITRTIITHAITHAISEIDGVASATDDSVPVLLSLLD